MEQEARIVEQLRQLQAVMHRRAFQNFKDHSSYRGQGKILSILKDQPEMDRRELEERLSISRQGLTELLSKLEKSGLILRVPSQTDRRAMVICLTEKGRAAAEETGERIHPLTGLLGCLSEEEQGVFSEYLERILKAQKTPIDHCTRCRGPEYCTHDYLKYGHTKPNKEYCKYIHLFTDPACDEAEKPEGGGEA